MSTKRRTPAPRKPRAAAPAAPAGGRLADMPADDSQNLRDEVESDEMPEWLPPALRRNAAPGLGLALRRLGLGEQDLHEVRAMIARDVADARARGGSWGQIGLALGISAEAARTRYGRPTGRPAPGEGS